MPTKTYTRNLIIIEVLSEDPLPDDIGLPEIVREGYEGSYSIEWDFIASVNDPISPELMAQLLLKQGSDPEFFGLHADGSPVDD